MQCVSFCSCCPSRIAAAACYSVPAAVQSLQLSNASSLASRLDQLLPAQLLAVRCPAQQLLHAVLQAAFLQAAFLQVCCAHRAVLDAEGLHHGVQQCAGVIGIQ